MSRARWQGCGLILGGALLAACLGACLVAGLSQFWLPTAGWPIGYTVYACADAARTGGPRLEVAWSVPQLMSSIVPGSPPRPGCAFLPWLPMLPPTGRLLFPP